ncbi:sporulation protein SpoIISA [Bacillus sp. AFS002410]|uniref:type II toxin-antitoxin system SpoIISA family toxin n=1 Tax=Bacillus sp. AFS002410 TaxID=2033481 RepID=UPI000BF1BAD3|nr:type II toxin-antitoxin system SpoIISA family toxin [Bacillus sp. AFS002410]PEJ58019.1 sporulation protein SpoIISA [Bacillus sp. AFS002410]
MANRRKQKLFKRDGFKIFLKIVILVVVIAVSFWLKLKWGNSIFSFIQEYKWIILVIISGIILYISWAFFEFFKKYRQNLRKTWYFFFIVGIVLLLNQNGFEIKEWQRYTLIAGMFIFVDLALFLTPGLKKFAGAEMEPINDMESVNEEMKKVISRTQGRIEQFINILDAIDSSRFKTENWSDIESYRSSLEDFLAVYGDTCRQEITVFNMDDTALFKQELTGTLGIKLTDDEIKSLKNNDVLHFDAKTTLIPFMARIYPVVITVDSEKDVLDIDPDNLISLSTIHSWLKQ